MEQKRCCCRRTVLRLSLIKAIFCKDFALKLSGISDLYDLFGRLVNEVQTVDLLRYERYDNCMDLVMKF